MGCCLDFFFCCFDNDNLNKNENEESFNNSSEDNANEKSNLIN